MQICFYSELARAKHRNTAIGINTSPFVDAMMTAVQMVLMVNVFYQISDDSQMQSKEKTTILVSLGMLYPKGQSYGGMVFSYVSCRRVYP
jgi:hypothetical protein